MAANANSRCLFRSLLSMSFFFSSSACNLPSGELSTTFTFRPSVYGSISLIWRCSRRNRVFRDSYMISWLTILLTNVDLKLLRSIFSLRFTISLPVFSFTVLVMTSYLHPSTTLLTVSFFLSFRSNCTYLWFLRVSSSLIVSCLTSTFFGSFFAGETIPYFSLTFLAKLLKV